MFQDFPGKNGEDVRVTIAPEPKAEEQGAWLEASISLPRRFRECGIQDTQKRAISARIRAFAG